MISAQIFEGSISLWDSRSSLPVVLLSARTQICRLLRVGFGKSLLVYTPTHYNSSYLRTLKGFIGWSRFIVQGFFLRASAPVSAHFHTWSIYWIYKYGGDVFQTQVRTTRNLCEHQSEMAATSGKSLLATR